MTTAYLTPERRAALLADYRDLLLDEDIPFWLTHGMDREHGGIITSLDRRGAIVDTDKSIWFQGRAGWMFATLFNTAGRRSEHLEAALSCVGFLHRHGHRDDGKMWFTVTREGRPLRMRRYVYSECFAAIAYAAVHKATGDGAWRERALAAAEGYWRSSFTPGLIAPKTEPGTRSMRGIGPLMIAIVTAQELRANLGDVMVHGRPCSAWIAHCIADIERYFVKPDIRAVMETVDADGGIIDHFDGRLLNPGHAIEAAWFILHEARLAGNQRWQRLGLDMLDWMWERGWDREYGGLRYFTDVHGKPIQEYWHHMKFWWPHNEAIIATLLAHILTGDQRYADMHRQVHEWSFAHFHDREHGEWFGYLDRAGNLTTELKGNMWKGPFHMPRMKWYCTRLLDGTAFNP